jgi:hypothetical protein
MRGARSIFGLSSYRRRITGGAAREREVHHGRTTDALARMETARGIKVPDTEAQRAWVLAFEK